MEPSANSLMELMNSALYNAIQSIRLRFAVHGLRLELALTALAVVLFTIRVIVPLIGHYFKQLLNTRQLHRLAPVLWL